MDVFFLELPNKPEQQNIYSSQCQPVTKHNANLLFLFLSVASFWYDYRLRVVSYVLPDLHCYQYLFL